MSNINWQQSSFCGGGGNNCVGVAALGEAIGLRESDDPGVVVTTTPAGLRALLLALKAGVGPATRAQGAGTNTM